MPFTSAEDRTLLALTEASTVAITLGVLTFLGVLVGAVFSYLGQREARAANRAVNNVPEGTPPLPVRVTHLEAKVDALIDTKQAHGVLLSQIFELLTRREGPPS